MIALLGAILLNKGIEINEVENRNREESMKPKSGSLIKIKPRQSMQRKKVANYQHQD